MELYTIICGQKRKAEKAICPNCKKEFLRRKNSKRPVICCSVKCKTEFIRSKRIEVRCFNCGKVVYRPPCKLKQSRHGFFFCSRKCKEFSQSLKGNCPLIRPSHYGTAKGRGKSKKLLVDTVNPVCEGCGEDKRYLLSVHHKDGNHMNDNPLNWEIVCFNCHALRHLKKVGDRWMYSTHNITDRTKLKKLGA